MAPDSPTARAAAPDSFGARGQLAVGDRTYEIFRLAALADRFDVARLPYSIKVLLENLLRHEDGIAVRTADIEATARWGERPERHGLGGADNAEIAFTPERVLLQDFTGVPSVVDLAAMRDALAELGGDPSRVDPLVPVDLVIDHSVIVEVSGSADAYDRNVDIEYQRNIERYQVLRWSQHAFDRLRVVPPGTGICHQVNLEYLSQVVFATDDGRAYCDTLVGADSHTTMVNGLGVLGWGVGGIEAEAAMLGQPLSMLLPPVVGFRLTGEQPVGTTATDLVLTITHLLRLHGVVGKFVEFHGPGVAAVPLPNRATIGNMSPEYGATCAIFPVDEITLDYLRFTGRDEGHIALVEAYAKEQGLFHRGDGIEPVYSESIELDLSTVVPSIAGPSRPQDLVPLGRAPETDSSPPGSRTGTTRRMSASRTATSWWPPSPVARTRPTRRSWWRPACWRPRRRRAAFSPSLGSKPLSLPAPGWSWTIWTGRTSRSRWPRSASSSWASGARPASVTRDRSSPVSPKPSPTATSQWRRSYPAIGTSKAASTLRCA
jgi:aconitate hydratase